MIIAFIGPDGCGKTTLIKGLCQDLSPNHNIVELELNYGSLPRLAFIGATIFGRKVPKKHEPGTFLIGQANPPLSILRACVNILYYSFDYWIGRSRIKDLSRSGVVLFSRYAHDYSYQYAYSRTPRFLRRFPQFFALEPDILITIYRSAKLIHAQKPELSVEEIKRQQREIDQLARGKNNFLRINGDNGVEATLQETRAALRRLGI